MAGGSIRQPLLWIVLLDKVHNVLVVIDPHLPPRVLVSPALTGMLQAAGQLGLWNRKRLHSSSGSRRSAATAARARNSSRRSAATAARARNSSSRKGGEGHDLPSTPDPRPAL